MNAALALRYWRELAIGVLVMLAVGTCVARDRAIAERARIAERAARLDSLLDASRLKVARVDTILVKDLTRVARALGRTDSIFTHAVDTIFLASDTLRERPLVPLPAADVAFLRDTLAPACSALQYSCKAFRDSAQERFALYEERLRTNVTSTSTREKVTWGVLGTALGVLGTLLTR